MEDNLDSLRVLVPKCKHHMLFEYVQSIEAINLLLDHGYKPQSIWRIFALTDKDEEIPIMDMGVNNEFMIIGGPSYEFVDSRKQDRSITLTFNYLSTI